MSAALAKKVQVAEPFRPLLKHLAPDDRDAVEWHALVAASVIYAGVQQPMTDDRVHELAAHSLPCMVALGLGAVRSGLDLDAAHRLSVREAEEGVDELVELVEDGPRARAVGAVQQILLRVAERMKASVPSLQQAVPGPAFEEQIMAISLLNGLILALLISDDDEAHPSWAALPERARSIAKDVDAWNLERLPGLLLPTLHRQEVEDPGDIDATLGPDADTVLLAARTAFNAGLLGALDRILEGGLERFPDHDGLLAFDEATGPAEARPAALSEERARSLTRSKDWLGAHRNDHQGLWLAVRDGQLLASSPTVRQLRQEVELAPDVLVVRA